MTNSFEPKWISVPGATIADLLVQQKLSVSKAAKKLKYSEERLNKLIKGQVAITQEVAELLERNIGGATEFWLAREEQYRKEIGRLQKEGNRDAARNWLKEIPTADMERFGWIKKGQNNDDKIQLCLRFFGTNTIDEWRENYRDVLSVVAFRTSARFISEPGAVSAWIRKGELEAGKISCKNWDAEKLKQSIPELRRLTLNKNPESFLNELKSICANCGVALVIVRTPTGCTASGATRFISSDKAMVLLSFRHLTDDQFWFTFFHEIGHLLLHNKRAIFIEDGSDVTKLEEDEANKFAEETLIPIKDRNLMRTISTDRISIIRFAVNCGVSRGIVVGQLQYAGMLQPNQMNHLKRRFKWNGSTIELSTK